jgi:uncharacterized protein with NRDE domain
MCVIFFAYRYHPNYCLIVAANRDEYYERPTAPAHFWQDYQDILAGRDLEQLGTWMGVNRKTGNFAAITNHRDPSSIITGARSRGELVSKYLQGMDTPNEYLEQIKEQRDLYNGFHLLVGDLSSLWYYSWARNSVEQILPGIYGLSNDHLNTPWKKVQRGTDRLDAIIRERRSVMEAGELFSILSDSAHADDRELPDTGVGMEMERMLSSIFIQSPYYGTRSSTVLLVDYNNRVSFVERSLLNGQKEWKEASYAFQVGKK